VGVGLRIAVALAQIGEFSFIVASLGDELGLINPDLRQTLIAAAIVSIAMNPLLYRAIGPIERRLARKAASRVKVEPIPAAAVDPAHRAVVIGYGPVGRTVARLLSENGVTPTIVDLNIETVQALRQQGITAVYGDASRPETLIAAGVPASGSVILSVAGLPTAGEIIRESRRLSPRILILARTVYIREIPALKNAGANQVFSGESEVALTFTETILGRLGATAEQIDRERARVHNELSAEVSA
jgi:CPA2 family monovalent cation:H+ antiporter-2